MQADGVCCTQVYTWPDATLRELTDLVKEVKSEARRTTAKFEFAFVYPDRRGRNVLRQVHSDLALSRPDACLTHLPAGLTISSADLDESWSSVERVPSCFSMCSCLMMGNMADWAFHIHLPVSLQRLRVYS